MSGYRDLNRQLIVVLQDLKRQKTPNEKQESFIFRCALVQQINLKWVVDKGAGPAFIDLVRGLVFGMELVSEQKEDKGSCQAVMFCILVALSDITGCYGEIIKLHLQAWRPTEDPG